MKLWISTILMLLSPVLANATMLYYLPFDQNGSASLANLGSISGTATSVTGGGGGAAPTASTSVAPNLGSTYSERFTGSGVNAGTVVLPSSTTEFRLSSSSQKMTFSTWVYWNGALAAGQLSGVVNNYASSSNSGWGISITDVGEIRFNYGTGTSSTNRKSSTGAVVAGQWTLLTVTWDGSKASPLTFYANGLSVGSTTTGASSLASNAEPIRLGVTTNSMYNSLNGNMDDLAMWDAALGAGEVRALVTAPTLLNGYNAGVMNQLFLVAGGTSSSATIDALNWTQATGLNVSGRSLGDTWQSGGNYYMWLSGDALNAAGLVATSVPEPGTVVLLGLAAGVLLLRFRRRATL